MHYDVAVVGAGAAGLGAARSIAARDARVALITDGPPGGECTWTGCVPSKTLIAAARRGIPFAAAMRRVRGAIATVAATEDTETLTREGIDVLNSRAVFAGAHTLAVGAETLTFASAVIATGARASLPNIPGLADVPHLTSETVFDINERPTSLIVLGAGPVGCELSQAFSRFGTRVTLVEKAPRFLPGEEEAVSRVLTHVFGREGISCHTGAAVTEVSTVDEGVQVTLETGEMLHAEKILLAAGRTPNTDTLELASVGVKLTPRGYIVTNNHLETSISGIYAAGDVTGREPFTHAAFAMGRTAALNALRGKRQKYDARITPRAIFTDPEVAHVGATREETAAVDGRVAYLPLTELDRAVTEGETDGFIALYAGRRRILGNLGGGKILGATIVSPRAGEMIHEPTLAMHTNMFAGRLAETTHAYPTWSLGIQLAAAQFVTRMNGRVAQFARDDKTHEGAS